MNGDGYEFLDCGNGRRLERFARVVVDRPAPAALWEPGLPDRVWRSADLRFDRDTKWTGAAPDDWRIALGGTTMALRPAGGGQVGVFPEHVRVGELVSAAIHACVDASILNLFAHTGLVTLMAARTNGASVTHVDAAPASVRQARENAALSGLEDRPVRWIVDDALTFLRREVRRGRRYGVVVADPPAYGRSRKGGEWKFSRDLPYLLETAAELLADPPGRLFLTCHEEGFGRDEVTATVRSVMGGRAEAETLELVSECGGQALPAGVLVTWNR